MSGLIMEEVRTDAELQAQYIPRNPVSRVIQCAAVQSENEVRDFLKIDNNLISIDSLLNIDQHHPG